MPGISKGSDLKGDDGFEDSDFTDGADKSSVMFTERPAPVPVDFGAALNVGRPSANFNKLAVKVSANL